MQSTPSPFDSIAASIGAMPGRQLALVLAFVVFVVVAGNAVFALHYRRVGKPVIASLLDPRSFPLLRFNAREWWLLIAVFVVGLGIGVLAVLSG